MSHRKRGTAVNGDLFALEHPSLDLSAPFSSHVDVAFDGVTHQVLTTAGREAFCYADTVGEFAVGELRGHVIETLDSVATQATHRHQAIVSTDIGALSVHGYDGSERLLALVAALRPVATPLGIAIAPDDGVEIAAAPKVALATDVGLFEITPLTTATDRELPRWRGTAVAHGDLYGGTIGDESPYLVLVTRTARVVAMPAANTDADTLAASTAELAATWTT